MTAAALVAFSAVSSLLTFPYYLPYSNEAFGGPAQTHLRLHDSNVDWGQDLGRLADRLRERHPGEPVWLVYKGSGVPSSYGIASRNPLTVPPDQVHGLLVVSDSSVAKAEGRLRRAPEGGRTGRRGRALHHDLPALNAGPRAQRSATGLSAPLRGAQGLRATCRRR